MLTRNKMLALGAAMTFIGWATAQAAGADNGRVAAATPLATVVVQGGGSVAGERASFDGVVEAVRQTTLSAQVPGAIVALLVKVGDRVKAGQDILRMDARAASQSASASIAQADAARAAMDVATKDYERQKQLFQKQYISQAALDRAQAQFQATQAQVQALQAQVGVAQTQAGFFVIRAPYSGIISEVPVALGDMAMPGRPLVTLFDPSELRVTVAVPQSVAHAVTAQQVQLEFSGLSPALQATTSLKVLPVVDAATHTVQLRLGVPTSASEAAPGMFTRVWLPATGPVGAGSGGATGGRLYVASSAVVRRAEMTGLYVLDAQGRPQLRQVRLGQPRGDQVEVLSGVQAGEKVAADAQAAAKVR